MGWTHNHERAQRPDRQRVDRTKLATAERHSELRQRTLSHVCETGGMRWSYLRGAADATR